MSQNFDPEGIEQATAVAAAAYAIFLLKQSSIPEQEKISEGLKPSLVGTKSRKEDETVAFHEFGDVSEPSSDSSSKKNREILNSKVSYAKIPDEDQMRNTSEASIEESRTSTDNPKSYDPSLERVPTIIDKPRGRIPSFRKSPSSADKPVPSMEETATVANAPISTEKTTNFPAPSKLNSPNSVDKPAIPMQKIPTLTEQQLNKTNPDVEASKMPTPKRDVGSTSKTATPPNKPLSKADEWELAELARVRNRHEEAIERIRSWENKKKAKARRKLDNIEGESSMRRPKATEKYQVEMQRIQQIVGAAYEKAKERLLYEERKVRQKANVIRETGKIPASCFCC